MTILINKVTDKMKLRSGKAIQNSFKQDNQPFRLILLNEKIVRKEVRKNPNIVLYRAWARWILNVNSRSSRSSRRSSRRPSRRPSLRSVPKDKRKIFIDFDGASEVWRNNSESR